MDKLVNISRQGGYPMCAETLQVLYDNARAVNVLLVGLNLPNKSAVILGTEDYSEAHDGYRYLYVVLNYNRRLVRYDPGAGVSMFDLTSAKVTITETAHNVYDNNGVEIVDVYREERAVIEYTDNANERWTFYRLKDVLELGVYTDLLPQLRAQLANTNITLDENYGNVLCKNAKKLRMKLKLDVVTQYSLNNSANDFVVTIPIQSGNVVSSSNATVFYGSNYHKVKTLVKEGNMTIYGDEALFVLIHPNIGTSASWSIYINTEILL